MPPAHLALRVGLVACLALLAGCQAIIDRGTAPAVPRAETGPIADAVPRVEPRSKGGNPASYVVFGKRYYTLKSSKGFTERGVASWYGKKFHGRKTSNGEVYDMYAMTAAHKRLPLPTYVHVKNLDNGKTTVVRVNDRGPFHDNRIIDLSYSAARKIGMADSGTAFVEIRAIDPSDPESTPPSTTPPTQTAGSGSGIYLQIGAFQSVANAELLRNRVAAVVPLGVRVKAINRGGTVLHRVQVGPVASVELADIVVAALTGLGVSDHYFVIE